MLDEFREFQEYSYDLSGPARPQRLKYANLRNGFSGLERAMTILARQYLFSAPEFSDATEEGCKDLLRNWCSDTGWLGQYLKQVILAEELSRLQSRQAHLSAIFSLILENDQAETFHALELLDAVDVPAEQLSPIRQCLQQIGADLTSAAFLSSLKSAAAHSEAISLTDPEAICRSQEAVAELQALAEVYHQECFQILQENLQKLDLLIGKFRWIYKQFPAQKRRNQTKRRPVPDLGTTLKDVEYVLLSMELWDHGKALLKDLGQNRSVVDRVLEISDLVHKAKYLSRSFGSALFQPGIPAKESSGLHNDAKKITFEKIIANALAEGPLTRRYLLWDSPDSPDAQLSEADADVALRVTAAYFRNRRRADQQFVPVNLTDISNWSCKGRSDKLGYGSLQLDGVRLFETVTVGGNFTKLSLAPAWKAHFSLESETALHEKLQVRMQSEGLTLVLSCGKTLLGVAECGKLGGELSLVPAAPYSAEIVEILKNLTGISNFSMLKTPPKAPADQPCGTIYGDLGANRYLLKIEIFPKRQV
jgi:hypothetical protein